MQLVRMFSTENAKGTRNYLNSQKKYEIMRTALYFGISFALLAAGWITTGSKVNLLTIVAVLGCLPASKSLVGTIMFLRQKSCSEANAERVAKASEGLDTLFDMVFTSYDKTFQVAHMAVKGNTVCGFSEDPKFDEQAFIKHIDPILKADRFRDVTVKVFKDCGKYCDRLAQLREVNAEEGSTGGIIATLKSVSL